MRVKRSVGAVGDSKHACLAWMCAVASEAVHARVSEDVVVGLGFAMMPNPEECCVWEPLSVGTLHRGDRGLGWGDAEEGGAGAWCGEGVKQRGGYGRTGGRGGASV